MSTTFVTRSAYPGDKLGDSFYRGTGAPPTQRKMTIATRDGKVKLTVPYAPREVDHGSMASEYAEIERPGRAPIYSRSGNPLRTQAFTLDLVGTNPDYDVTPLIDVLRALATTTQDVIVSYSKYESGTWRLDGLSYKTLRRRPGDNAPTHCTADVTLTVASGYTVAVGPIGGGAKPVKTVKKGGGKYEVKKGDTLHKIAKKVYGDASKWRVVGDANKIKGKKGLKVGKKIKIPVIRVARK